MGSQNAREKAPPVHVAREARAAAVPAPQTVVLSTPVAQPSTHASSPAPPPPAGDPPHPPASSWNFAYVPVRQPPHEHVAYIASNKPSLPNARRSSPPPAAGWKRAWATISAPFASTLTPAPQPPPALSMLPLPPLARTSCSQAGHTALTPA